MHLSKRRSYGHGARSRPGVRRRGRRPAGPDDEGRRRSRRYDRMRWPRCEVLPEGQGDRPDGRDEHRGGQDRVTGPVREARGRLADQGDDRGRQEADPQAVNQGEPEQPAGQPARTLRAAKVGIGLLLSRAKRTGDPGIRRAANGSDRTRRRTGETGRADGRPAGSPIRCRPVPESRQATSAACARAARPVRRGTLAPAVSVGAAPCRSSRSAGS